MNHSNTNTTADDICGVVGYTATSLICAWFGGRNLYVPLQPAVGHPLGRLIGVRAFERLVEAFPGDHLAVPDERWRRTADRAKRTVAVLLNSGVVDEQEIAERVGLTKRRVNQLKFEVAEEDLLELFREDALLKNPDPFALGEDPLEKSA